MVRNWNLDKTLKEKKKKGRYVKLHRLRGYSELNVRQGVANGVEKGNKPHFWEESQIYRNDIWRFFVVSLDNSREKWWGSSLRNLKGSNGTFKELKKGVVRKV